MSLVDFVYFLANSPRVEAFREAIERTVRPGHVVLDLGTGIGTFALLAARAGARVYAVDADPVIDVAKELARDNGLSDRITYLEGWSEALEPPERADVLIFEDYASQLCDPGTEALLEDVRRRWLKADALAIPRGIRVSLAPVCSPATYRTLAPWEDEAPYGLNVERLAGRVLNDLHSVHWTADVPLASAVEVARVDPLSGDSLGFSVDTAWRVTRDGELHGLGLWMDFDLAEGVTLSNAPVDGTAVWGQVFFPLASPLPVREGDEVTARITPLRSAAGQVPWWKWRVGVHGQVQEMNTFRGMPLSLDRLQRAIRESRGEAGRNGGDGRTGAIRRAVRRLIEGHRPSNWARRSSAKTSIATAITVK